MDALEAFVSEASLEAERWPAYVLDREGRIVHVNGAWDRVAAPAGGPLAADVLGTRWLDHITGDEVKAWHRALLDRLLDGPPALRERAVSQTCECNTPERWRRFVTRFEALGPEGGEAQGVLALTLLLDEGPIGEHYPIAPPDEPRFRTPAGLLVQCASCRRVRVAVDATGNAWELVPAYVERAPPGTSHGICRVCFELYYKGI